MSPDKIEPRVSDALIAAWIADAGLDPAIDGNIEALARDLRDARQSLTEARGRAERAEAVLRLFRVCETCSGRGFLGAYGAPHQADCPDCSWSGFGEMASPFEVAAALAAAPPATK